MLFATVALVLATFATASPLKRAPVLVVSLSSEVTSVASIQDISLVATVENTSDDDIKVLKYGTVLDSTLPTRSFTVAKDGVEIQFQGIKLSLSLDAVTEDEFVVIPARSTVSATHTNLATLYDFEAVGTGAFSFTPKTTFQVASADTAVSDIADTLRVTSTGSTVNIEVTGDVEKREIPVIDKRATVSCSSSTQASFISSSYSEGKSLASLAASYINTNGASGSLYQAYFGTGSTSRPLSVLNAVASESSSSRTLNCSDPYGVCTGSVIAYTVISTTNIYYCSIFYNEVTTSRLCTDTTVASRNVRGGTTLHELTHAVADTDDIGYGCSYDRSLASSSPSQAAINADNYNCFATAVYYETQC